MTNTLFNNFDQPSQPSSPPPFPTTGLAFATSAECLTGTLIWLRSSKTLTLIKSGCCGRNAWAPANLLTLRSNQLAAPLPKLMAAHCELVNPEDTPMNIAEDFKKAGLTIAIDTETAMAPRAFEGRDCVPSAAGLFT